MSSIQCLQVKMNNPIITGRHRILGCLGIAVTLWLQCFCLPVSCQFDYKDALTKSIIFLEAQRSGKLPYNSRIPWRGDSGLTDGFDQYVDLVGGYYDAGDNVKYGLPMAFTVTLLSWGVVQYEQELESAGELGNVKDAIKWGTDYFLKASEIPNQLWVQVGDPNADHSCWENPETMDTPRTALKIDNLNPGTEIAAETAAAFAASSIVFKQDDPNYSQSLLERAIRDFLDGMNTAPSEHIFKLFTFADQYRGTYTGECPFYCSFSGYEDELAWAATWLYIATGSSQYSGYVLSNMSCTTPVAEFSWDLKCAGVQVLLASHYFNGGSEFGPYRVMADSFFCAVLPDSPSFQLSATPGGLLYTRDGANTQYVTSVSFLASIYDLMLSGTGQTLQCSYKSYQPTDLLNFAKQQVDYLLGNNPKGMSYMVGFGSNYPQQVHHRGASIVSIHLDSRRTTCLEGFMIWFDREAPNPNELTGAIVGGPDLFDAFQDYRADSSKLEPTTYVNAPIIGVLAKLHSLGAS